MHSVWAAQIGLRFDLGPVNHLVQARCKWVCSCVDNMDIVRPHAWHQQVFTAHTRVVVAGRTGIPAHVMQFIPNARHF